MNKLYFYSMKTVFAIKKEDINKLMKSQKIDKTVMGVGSGGKYGGGVGGGG